MSSEGPLFQPVAVAPSSAHPQYHHRAIQIHGRPKFEGRSAHQEDYQQWELPKHEQPGSHEATRKALPFNGTSSYADTFVAHALEPRTPPSPVHPGHTGTKAKFDATSSYAQDYDAKELPLREPAVPRAPPKATAKFDGTSSYKDTYLAHEIPPAEAVKPPEYKPRQLPFDGKSAYAEDFVTHPLEQREILQAVRPPAKSVKFEGSSTSHNAFVVHPLEPQVAAAPAVREIRQVPFEGTTTHLEAFKAWPLDPPSKPEAHATASRPALPFNGTTTHQDAFQGWELPPRREALGIATIGDRLHALIPAQLPVPASTKQTFTTIKDNQEEMCLMIYQGSSPVASQNRLLGQFQLVKLPPAPARVPRVQVTFNLDASNVLTVEALDLESGRQHVWYPSEGTKPAVNIQPAELLAKDEQDSIRQAVAVAG